MSPLALHGGGQGAVGHGLGALLDQAQAQMDVAEQAPLGRGSEGGAAGQLDGAADVVQERRSDQQIRAQAREQPCRLAADRGDTDGVLQQAARVVVVAVERGGQLAQQAAQALVVDEAADDGAQAELVEQRDVAVREQSR